MTYDPLSMLVKGHEAEKDAYDLGVLKGKELGQEAAQDELYKLRERIAARIFSVRKMGDARGADSAHQKSIFMSGAKPYEAYASALEDFLKILVTKLL